MKFYYEDNPEATWGTEKFSMKVKDILSWLEKQGGKKPAIEMKTPEESLGIDSETYSKIVDECIYGEQKPANKPQRIVSAEAKEAMYDKPAWSEVDKDFMYDTLSNLTELKDRYGEEYGNVGKCIDWLKSLKPQNRWKPSDEQLEAVRIAAEIGTANNSWAMDILKCMYQYLKKLREE